MNSIDWNDWYKYYRDSPSMQARLRIVRRQIRAAVSARPTGPIRLLSICAGDGRDVIAALADHPRRDDVQATLIDTHAEAIERGQAMVAGAGLEKQIHFSAADAALAVSYQGIVPADVVLVSGVLGHLMPDSVTTFIRSLPSLCRSGGELIWNRHLTISKGRRMVPEIRRLLAEHGFQELHFEVTGPNEFACFRHRFQCESAPLDPQCVLFEFHGLDRIMERDSAIGKLVLDPKQMKWRGRHEDIELIVNDDDYDPRPGDIAALREYLGRFRDNLTACRDRLFLGWSYRPVGLAVESDGRVGVRFRSRLPLLGWLTTKQTWTA